jgi:DNA helicase HerA-like ATPase
MVGDRWAIIGATGSGKTWLSRDILKFYANSTAGRVPITIFDTKMQGDFKEFEKRNIANIVEGNDPRKVVSVMWKKPFTIWKPEFDNVEDYNEYFRLVYQSAKHKHTPSITYIDELSSITSQGGKAPDYYDVLLKQGRGMHNGIISVTQSPAYIPQNLLRQATHMIRMRLNDDYDIKKIARTMGNDALDEPEHDYGFWYRDCTKPKRKQPAIYFPDRLEFLGK